MSKSYYYLVAGLPDLTLEDSKLSYTVADFRTDFYSSLSADDQKLLDLFYLKFDNSNVLALLKDKETTIEHCGLFTKEELLASIESLKNDDAVELQNFPTYLSTFIKDYLHDNLNPEILSEDQLTSAYYNYCMSCKNPFIVSWYTLNLNINNVLTALSARKYGWNVGNLIVGDTPICEALKTSGARDFGLSGELKEMDEIIKISEMSGLLDREKKLDQLRWQWMEEQSFFNYFTIERLFVFLSRLEMIERWIALDKEKGHKMFRGIIESLKQEIQIPAEFK